MKSRLFLLAATAVVAVWSLIASFVGFKRRLIAFAETGQGAVVMTNGGVNLLAAEIFRSIANEYGWPALQTEVREIAKVDPKIYLRFRDREIKENRVK